MLSSCSSNHGPKDYNDVVQANFVNSCNETNTAKKDVPDPLQFCECVYAKVKDTYTFAEFKVLDQKLRDALADTKNAPKTPADLAKIDARYVSEVDSCRTAGPAAPGAGGSTSTTLATTTTTK